MDSKDLSQYLQPSPTMESQHPQVLAFVEEHLQGERDPVRKAVKLFFAVRLVDILHWILASGGFHRHLYSGQPIHFNRV